MMIPAGAQRSPEFLVCRSFRLQYARDLVSVSSEANQDRKSTRLNSSHSQISYAVFCLKKKKYIQTPIATHLSRHGNVPSSRTQKCSFEGLINPPRTEPIPVCPFTPLAKTLPSLRSRRRTKRLQQTPQMAVNPHLREVIITCGCIGSGAHASSRPRFDNERGESRPLAGPRRFPLTFFFF